MFADENYTREALQEVHDLFYKEGAWADKPREQINSRLFQIFVQNEEMMK
jgi:hypothetical protein